MKDFVVACDQWSSNNGCAFGVNMWALAPNGTKQGRVVEKYWYGTGNNIITLNKKTGIKRRIEIHEQQTKDMHRVLNAIQAKWKLMQAGKDREVLAEMLDDVKHDRKFAGHPLDRFHKAYLKGNPFGDLLQTKKVVLQDASRLYMGKLAAAFADAGLKTTTDMAEASLQKPGRRYSMRPVTREAMKWLTSLHRYGFYWYVKGDDELVITDDLKKAVAHYETQLKKTAK